MSIIEIKNEELEEVCGGNRVVWQCPDLSRAEFHTPEDFIIPLPEFLNC